MSDARQEALEAAWCVFEKATYNAVENYPRLVIEECVEAALKAYEARRAGETTAFQVPIHRGCNDELSRALYFAWDPDGTFAGAKVASWNAVADAAERHFAQRPAQPAGVEFEVNRVAANVAVDVLLERADKAERELAACREQLKTKDEESQTALGGATCERQISEGYCKQIGVWCRRAQDAEARCTELQEALRVRTESSVLMGDHVAMEMRYGVERAERQRAIDVLQQAAVTRTAELRELTAKLAEANAELERAKAANDDLDAELATVTRDRYEAQRELDSLRDLHERDVASAGEAKRIISEQTSRAKKAVAEHAHIHSRYEALTEACIAFLLSVRNSGGEAVFSQAQEAGIQAIADVLKQADAAAESRQALRAQLAEANAAREAAEARERRLREACRWPNEKEDEQRGYNSTPIWLRASGYHDVAAWMERIQVALSDTAQSAEPESAKQAANCAQPSAPEPANEWYCELHDRPHDCQRNCFKPGAVINGEQAVRYMRAVPGRRVSHAIVGSQVFTCYKDSICVECEGVAVPSILFDGDHLQEEFIVLPPTTQPSAPETLAVKAVKCDQDDCPGRADPMDRPCRYEPQPLHDTDDPNTDMFAQMDMLADKVSRNAARVTAADVLGHVHTPIVKDPEARAQVAELRSALVEALRISSTLSTKRRDALIARLGEPVSAPDELANYPESPDSSLAPETLSVNEVWHDDGDMTLAPTTPGKPRVTLDGLAARQAATFRALARLVIGLQHCAAPAVWSAANRARAELDAEGGE